MTKNKNRNIVVLDTSVILYDSDSINKFEGYDIVIPLTVIDEIDKFRREDSQVGRHARKFIREIKTLKGDKGDYSEGLKRKDTGEIIKVVSLDDDRFFNALLLNRDKNDDKIIALCLQVKDENPDVEVSLITKDIALSVKASALGVKDKDYSVEEVGDVSSLYTGVYEFEADTSIIDTIYDGGLINLYEVVPEDTILYENAGVRLVDPYNEQSSILTIYSHGNLRLLNKEYKKIHNIRPKGMEQYFAADLLMDPDVRLVSLTGIAGSGKTLLAVACALSQLGGHYDRILISRPVQPLGKDIGFLPGGLEDKMMPWMKPIEDAVEFVFSGDRNKYEQFLDYGKIQIEPLTFIRGRSLPKTIFILDEAQNVSPHEVKTLITRIGEGSKIILTGDTSQIDNNYLDSTSNGLTYVIEKFKEYDIAGHITFTKGHRSRLATLAAEIL